MSGSSRSADSGATADRELVVETDPAPNEVLFLRRRLSAFNVAQSGVSDGAALAIFVRGEDGNPQAGLSGHTWGDCCEIDFLWVEEALRGQGLGTRLMDAAEQEARRRGCRQMVLTTFTFQAPQFYQRLGFEIVARIADYPRGHDWLLLNKQLDAEL